MCLIDKSATSVGFLVGFRITCDGFVYDDMRDRARLVMPHIRRAILIGKVIDLKKAEAHPSPIRSTASAPGCFWSMRPATSSMPIRRAI